MRIRAFVAVAFVAVLACGGNAESKAASVQTSSRIPLIPTQVDKGILLVEYREGNTPVERPFHANGRERGKTNVPVRMAAGTYTITLARPDDYTPEQHLVTIEEKGNHRVAFRQVASQ